MARATMPPFRADSLRRPSKEPNSMSKLGWSVAAGAVGAFAAATYLGTTWGSTPEERRRRLTSDDLVPEPSFASNHAITMRGRADAVWPWLVQTGWHRAGWYTYRWVDQLLFPAN